MATATPPAVATTATTAVPAEVQFQQLASQVIPQIVGDYAKSQTDLAKSLMEQANSESDPDKAQALRDEAQEINSKWEEQGTHRLTLHTLTGVLSGDVMGGVGSLAVAVSTPALANALDDMGIKGPLRDTILLATSAAVGGAANGTTGALNTTGQTVNNYLNHEESESKKDLQEQLLACAKDESCSQENQDQLQAQIHELGGLSDKRNEDLADAATKPNSEEFQDELSKVDKAVDSYGDPSELDPDVKRDYTEANILNDKYSKQAGSPDINNVVYGTGQAVAGGVEDLANDVGDIFNLIDLWGKADDPESQQALEQTAQSILDEAVADADTLPWESLQETWDEAEELRENGDIDAADQLLYGTIASIMGVGKGKAGSGKGSGGDKALQAEAFEKSIFDLPPGERVAQVKIKTKEVADSLGWKKDNKLSRMNGRDVYQGNDGNLYGVDTQHSRFEKINPKNGKHLGEVDINLNPIDGKLDVSGKHDLKVK